MATGTWTSQLCDISLQHFQNSGNNRWGILRWKETNTDDTTKATVKLDILDSALNALQSDLVGNTIVNNSRFNRSIDLAILKNVAIVDMYLRFKLESITLDPSVENIELNTNKKW